MDPPAVNRPDPGDERRVMSVSLLETVEKKAEWRVIYYVGELAIAVLDIFQKKTRATPVDMLAKCRRRLAAFKREETP